MNSIIERLKKKGVVRAVAYARFSSDMQREESIDAQLRAIEAYAQQNGILIVGQYCDKAQSGKTANREQFQQMIKDAEKKQFDIVIVHKLDRFSRNKYDSVVYKSLLKKQKVSLISVLEQFDDTPESLILESVLEAMNEYYIRNLGREVMKGLKENALKGKHTGGIPPLGYDVDPVTKKLVINEVEAQAVRLIYQMHLNGAGYKMIISELNANGYRTKRNREFCTNSLYEILRNEKYTGTLIYNKGVSKDENGKRNRHEYKDADEIISIPNAFPAIIDRELWEKVQYNMDNRKQLMSNRAIENYLLTGKIICGICGGKYVGSRYVSKSGKLSVSYVCNIHHRYINKCINKPINREHLECFVLDSIEKLVFDENKIPILVDMYNSKYDDVDRRRKRNAILSELNRIKHDIDRIVDVISTVTSIALAERLQTLEQKKELLEQSLLEIDKIHVMTCTEMTETFRYARKLFQSRDISHLKEIIQLFVDKIIIDESCAKVYLKFSNSKKNSCLIDDNVNVGVGIASGHRTLNHFCCCFTTQLNNKRSYHIITNDRLYFIILLLFYDKPFSPFSQSYHHP